MSARPPEDGSAFAGDSDPGGPSRVASFYKEATRRAALAGEPRPFGVKGPPLRHFLGELDVFAEPFRRPCAADVGLHPKLGKKVVGTPERPRLVVTRSNRHMVAQIVDDTKGHTLVIPKVEVDKFFDLPAEVLAGINRHAGAATRPGRRPPP